MKKFLNALIATLCFSVVHSQQLTDQVNIYFDIDSDVIDIELAENRRSVDTVVEILESVERDSLLSLTSINVSSYASPEGGRTYNSRLSERRSASIKSLLDSYISSEGRAIDDDLIKSQSFGIDWSQLRELVAQSSMQYRDEVIYIIDNTPEEVWGKAKADDRWESLLDSRIKHLMDLRGGRPYRYLAKEIFPKMRYSCIVTLSYHKHEPMVAEGDPFEFKAPERLELPIVADPCVWERRDILAIKSNLLFDAATLLNIELELPIGDRFSVAGEWVFPWWTWDNGEADSKRNRIQLLNGNVEAKYWLTNPYRRDVMCGWFASLYAGGGLYDLEHNAKGYQGEFFIAAGVGGGYAHTINQSGSLRMEYSVGLGYLKTNYRYYEAQYRSSDESWHPYKSLSGEYTFIGATKLKVSMVWLLRSGLKRRGGKR